MLETCFKIVIYQNVFVQSCIVAVFIAVSDKSYIFCKFNNFGTKFYHNLSTMLCTHRDVEANKLDATAGEFYKNVPNQMASVGNVILLSFF